MDDWILRRVAGSATSESTCETGLLRLHVHRSVPVAAASVATPSSAAGAAAAAHRLRRGPFPHLRRRESTRRRVMGESRRAQMQPVPA